MYSIKYTQIKNHRIYLFVTIVFFLFTKNVINAQSIEQKAMAKLSFMIGDWKGEGKYLNQNKEWESYSVLTKVYYDLTGELLVLKLRSVKDGKPLLSLHTVIQYDKEKDSYTYIPLTGKGTPNQYKGEVKGKTLTIWASEERRFIFRNTDNGEFNEYGENLVNGIWQKNFEDIMLPTTEIRF
ncbi:hypothetical protein [Aquimarina sp. 2201CG5-10]|uniref:hypothetical protein n=1 Tax=Aquimarina callyspongiae TaxID=3098150 RepID=UPI002AB5940C|nr:hypothetical protein [Aquimarina sp. 2201CG5-10]MDY8136234.1 hypothetical protein [Aquimarina sp. 2201CG5-10]